jgi:hypothetical protein
MIFKFPILISYERPCVPYPLPYFEPMHAWNSKKRFALLPRRLYEYEERSSILMVGVAPDEYRWFWKTSKVIWFEEYIEIETYDRNPHLTTSPNKPKKVAVDSYFVLLSLI